jgi:DNA primase
LVLLPKGEDPDSFVKQHGEKVFRDKINGSGFLLDFVIERIIQKQQLNTPKGKITTCDEIVPLLKKISDRMEQDLYVQKVCQRIGVKEAHMRSRMETASPKSLSAIHKRPNVATLTPSPQNAEKLVLKLMLSHPETIDIIDKDSLVTEFTEPDFKDLGMLLIRIYKQQGELSFPSIMDIVEKESWKKIIAENSFINDMAGDPVKILEDCIKDIRLKKNNLKRERINLLLKQAEAVHDEALTLKYQLEFQDLLKEKKRIMRFKSNFHQI